MNNATLLLRQIHPNFLQNDRVTSQAFRPTPKDEKKLSVYDGDLITPDKSYCHYTEKLRLASTGVMAVSVEECFASELEPFSDPEPFPEHVVIDFSGLSERSIKTKAKILKARAVARGWLYRDE
jgi:hypothetical protein